MRHRRGPSFAIFRSVTPPGTSIFSKKLACLKLIGFTLSKTNGSCLHKIHGRRQIKIDFLDNCSANYHSVKVVCNTAKIYWTSSDHCTALTADSGTMLSTARSTSWGVMSGSTWQWALKVDRSAKLSKNMLYIQLHIGELPLQSGSSKPFD